MKMPIIDEKVFYTVGQFAFFSIGLLGLVRVVDTWSVLASYDIFSNLSSSIFYFVLCFFFGYLKNKHNAVEVNDGDIVKMNQALENLNLGEEKNAEKGHNK
jgi:hypothetical protein